MLKLAEQLNVKNLNTQILHGIADMIRIVDVNNRVIFFNSSMQEMFKGQEGEAWCSIESEISGLCDMRVTERTLQTGEVIQTEMKIKGLYFSVKTSPILGDHREIVGAIEIYRNKNPEKELQIRLQKKNKAMMREMVMAKNIQQSLLPVKGFFEDVKINYLYEPAEMLSGDIFNVFEIDDNHLGFYMADIVGHGFAASMATMFIHQAMSNMDARIQRNPVAALEELNFRFQELELNVDIYFTIFYMVYNRRNNKLMYSNAGHNGIPIKISDGEITQLLSRGFPISRLFERPDFDYEEVEIYTGDELILYTDGVTEAKHGDEEFGIDRLIKVFELYGENALERLKIIFFNVAEEVLDDDMSLLYLSFY